jgi:hypothetical protein
MNGQRHALATLYPQGNGHIINFSRRTLLHGVTYSVSTSFDFPGLPSDWEIDMYVQ